VTEPGHAVETETLATTVTEHADYLSVLLTGLFVLQLALGLLVVVLTTTTVLSSFSWGRGKRDEVK
jgi:hypothetical protein